MGTYLLCFYLGGAFVMAHAMLSDMEEDESRLMGLLMVALWPLTLVLYYTSARNENKDVSP
jgi:hypothetical protein